MQTVNKSYTIHANIEMVWKGLTDAKIIEKWSGSRCKMSEEEGASFFLWDGDIWGKNIKVLKEKELVQEWFAGKWDKPSIVKFELRNDGGNTILLLTHTDIPDNESKAIDTGWDDYYLEPLKVVVEGR